MRKIDFERQFSQELKKHRKITKNNSQRSRKLKKAVLNEIKLKFNKTT